MPLETWIPILIASLAVPLLAWISKTLYDINGRLKRDDERWMMQAQQWESNQADHNKAFSEIQKLEKGQAEIKQKLAKMEAQLDIALHGQPQRH